MATFSKNSFKALNYNSFRPHYPSSFYQTLSKYATGGDESKLPLNKGLDLGCGTGVATYLLLNFVDKVVGVDLSPKMIETAQSLIPTRCQEMAVEDKSRIEFMTGSAEEFVNLEPQKMAQGSVDLIVAAQCIHWFQDYDTFFRSCNSLLKKGGTLAYWYYVDPIMVDFNGPAKGEKKEVLEKAFQIYNKYNYDDPKYIGPHWEQPGRSIIRDLCVKVNEGVPKDVFTDINVNTFIPDFDGKHTPSEDDLDLTKTNISLDDFVLYLRTYSGYHTFKDVTGDKDNVMELFISECESELGWDRNTTKIDIIWRTGYVFMKKP